MTGVSSIIFDLGGVILPIFPDRTIQSLHQLLGKQASYKDVVSQIGQQVVALESGQIDSQSFLLQLESLLGGEHDHNKLRIAWRLMLGTLPPGRLDLLRKVRQHYRTFLLSNTNPLHFEVYAAFFYDGRNPEGLDQLFEGLVLSYLEGVMKPDVRIYQTLLHRYGLEPQHSLFLDDNQQNIAGAKASGIQGIWLPAGQDLNDLFDMDGRLKEEYCPC